MNIIADQKELMNRIEGLLEEIENKIEVERRIDKTKKEILGDISDSVGTPAYMQTAGLVQYIKQQLNEEKSKTNPNIKQLMSIMSELNEVKEKIDVTGQEYNWRNARKYQTSNNPEFLKRIENLKVECLEIREEYLINNSNQMAENQSSASNQSPVRQHSL
ncbi:MAG: hypothetical protein FCO83_02185 [Spiroplasma sp. WSS]|uniref:hypothetical protein n=1 Tax=unclassified Spiroplasma TaxID=2637901 RepID=UPI001228185A|nr:hypothetical protein [Spiroplasma endosymbiont of Lariophagus distinguendus]TLF25896.1 MAG: hypothetical protein FCO83_02185 [Spiroplasma sp. WSS]